MIYRSDFPVPPELMASGARYETFTGRIGGHEYELFRNAPPTLNQRLAETLALRRASPSTVDLNLEGGQNLIDFDLHGERRVHFGLFASMSSNPASAASATIEATQGCC